MTVGWAFCYTFLVKILFESYKNSGTLHHAYLILGAREAAISGIIDFLEKGMKISASQNPNFWKGEFDTLKIDEAREISEMQTNRAFGADAKKIFIISANAIAREAQNALLKVFEEPTPDTHFFLVMPSAESLLPTLRSRLFIISHESQIGIAPEAKKFLQSGKTARLAVAKEFADDISDEKKTKTDAAVFLNEVEQEMRKNIGTRALTKEEAAAFSELIKFRDYLNDRAPSVKMLLEHLALVLPELK